MVIAIGEVPHLDARYAFRRKSPQGPWSLSVVTHTADSPRMPTSNTKSDAHFELISYDECVELLAREEVGRLAWVAQARPEIVPVNYAWDGEAVVVRCDPGEKLNDISNAEVALEVDRIDRVRREGWSVVVHGVAHETSTDEWPKTALPPDELYLRPWLPGSKSHWVRIVPRTITGRRIRRDTDAASPLWTLAGDTFSGRGSVAQ